MSAPRFIDGLSTIAGDFDVLLCDVWGVIHNGITPFADACAALTRFRAAGGRVVLITNSPRPSDAVRAQVMQIGVPDNAYDAIVSSGEVTRRAIAAHAGERAFHLGPARDAALFDGLDCAFAPLAEADYIVCTGLFDDESETPDDYAVLLAQAHARHLPMICANPDLVVHRGDKLIYCAGALAEHYHALGGAIIMAGKPHAPIYDEALRLADEARGAPSPRARILAIGDSLRTDVDGAHQYGLKALFISAGIHVADFGDAHSPDRERLMEALRKIPQMPLAVMSRLVW